MKAVSCMVILLCVIALSAIPAAAQAPAQPTKVDLSWIPSSGTYTANKVMRANGAASGNGCVGALTQIGIVTGVTAGYSDLASASGLVVGQKYCYTVRALDTNLGLESGDSIATQVVFAFPPPAPTGLGGVAK